MDASNDNLFLSHNDVNDSLNLKSLIQLIGDFVRESRDIGSLTELPPRNAVTFFRFVLSDVFPEKKTNDFKGLLLDAAVLKLQKLLSGNLRPENLRNGKDDVLDVILNVRSQPQLRSNTDKLTRSLSRLSDASGFFYKLVRNASLLFFSPSEKNEIVSCYHRKDYEPLLFRIVRHSFETTHNLPVFFAERTYQEALLSDPQSPQQLVLMRIAADNGHEAAALFYANYRKKQREWSVAYTYYRKAVPGDCALWSIAELLEKGLLSREKLDDRLIRMIEEMIDDLGSERYELRTVECSEKNPSRYESLATAYRIYFVLAYQRGFSRAWSDMARMLESPLFEYPSGGWKDKKWMINTYRANAIRGTSAQALYDWADSLSSEEEDSDATDGTIEDYQFWKEEMLEAAASLGSAKAAYQYALMRKDDLHDTDNSPLQWLQLALRLDSTGINGKVHRELARLQSDADKKTEHQKKVAYLKDAINYGCLDAAYDLGRLYYESYLRSNRKEDLNQSNRFLRIYLSGMSQEVKNAAKELLSLIETDDSLSAGEVRSY